MYTSNINVEYIMLFLSFNFNNSRTSGFVLFLRIPRIIVLLNLILHYD